VKTCTQCGVEKPLEEYGRNTKSRDGHRAECRKCIAARQRRRYVPSAKAGATLTKTCAQCGTVFSYIYRSGRERTFCGDLCKHRAMDDLKAARGLVVERRCACGSTDVARVGKPVCPACKVDRRDPEKARAKERRRTLRRYGLSEEDWNRMLLQQEGRCAICRTDRPGGRGELWHIDHCHVTNRVRGLLCHNCNVGIGNFHDDPQLLLAAAKYIQESRLRASA